MSNEKKVSRQRAWQLRKAAAGKCYICGKALRTSAYVRCKPCRLRHNQRQREYLARRREAAA